MLIERFGTPAQLDACAADARVGKRSGVRNSGPPGADVTLTPLESGWWRLHGGKTFASGAAYIEPPLVTGALPDGGWQMIVLDADKLPPAIDRSRWCPFGMRAFVSHRVSFDEIEIDGSALIGAAGDYYREPYFSGGAVRFVAVQLGGAEALWAAVRDHLIENGRTEDPLVVACCGEIALTLESGRLRPEGAARGAVRPEECAEQTVRYVAMARPAMERICLNVMERAERLVGARGLMHPPSDRTADPRSDSLPPSARPRRSSCPGWTSDVQRAVENDRARGSRRAIELENSTGRAAPRRVRSGRATR